MMQAQRPKRVLFICNENSNRSQMADVVFAEMLAFKR